MSSEGYVGVYFLFGCGWWVGVELVGCGEVGCMATARCGVISVGLVELRQLKGRPDFFFEITVMHLVLLSKRGAPFSWLHKSYTDYHISTKTFHKHYFSLPPTSQHSIRVGHHVLLPSERIFLLRSFKEHNVLLCSFFVFLVTYETQKNDAFFAFFSKEHKRMQRTQCSFAKNFKECKELNILLQRT